MVTFPDFEWGVTQGATEEEAPAMAVDALAMIVADFIENGKELPSPSKPRGREYRTIELPAMESMKAELYQAFRASGLTKVELARRLEIPKTTVDRLFEFRNHTRLRQMEAAFRALGKQLRVEVRAA